MDTKSKLRYIFFVDEVGTIKDSRRVQGPDIPEVEMELLRTPVINHRTPERDSGNFLVRGRYPAFQLGRAWRGTDLHPGRSYAIKYTDRSRVRRRLNPLNHKNDLRPICPVFAFRK
jgi:hypothetical protein